MSWEDMDERERDYWAHDPDLWSDAVMAALTGASLDYLYLVQRHAFLLPDRAEVPPTPPK